MYTTTILEELWDGHFPGKISAILNVQGPEASPCTGKEQIPLLIIFPECTNTHTKMLPAPGNCHQYLQMLLIYRGNVLMKMNHYLHGNRKPTHYPDLPITVQSGQITYLMIIAIAVKSSKIWKNKY